MVLTVMGTVGCFSGRSASGMGWSRKRRHVGHVALGAACVLTTTSLSVAQEPARRAEAGFYFSGSLLGVLHAHGSTYRSDAYDDEVRQGSAGAGYELSLMLGSKKKKFAFGGAASFVHVPNARVVWNDDEDTGSDVGIYAITAGPAVDYSVSQHFFIGGLMGVAVEGVPIFQLAPQRTETLLGFGAGLWLGFHWPIAEQLRLGVALTGHVRQTAHRDIDWVSDRDRAEGSVSLGLGVRVARF